jgi:hypothetical protein
LNESFSKNFSVILKKKIVEKKYFLKTSISFFGVEMCSCFSNANFSFDVWTTISEWVL